MLNQTVQYILNVDPNQQTQINGCGSTPFSVKYPPPPQFLDIFMASSSFEKWSYVSTGATKSHIKKKYLIKYMSFNDCPIGIINVCQNFNRTFITPFKKEPNMKATGITLSSKIKILVYVTFKVTQTEFFDEYIFS